MFTTNGTLAEQAFKEFAVDLNENVVLVRDIVKGGLALEVSISRRGRNNLSNANDKFDI